MNDFVAMSLIATQSRSISLQTFDFPDQTSDDLYAASSTSKRGVARVLFYIYIYTCGWFNDETNLIEATNERQSISVALQLSARI